MLYAFITAGVVLLILLVIHFAKGKTDADEMDEMSGEEFEDYCAELLSRNGYTVESMTRETGDYGADIIISRSNEWIAVQCKRYGRPVGVKAVQEAYASMSYYKCGKCAVLTNNGFTAQAESLAAKNGVMLWDRYFVYSLRKSREKKTKAGSAVLTFSRIISDKQEGDFQLCIDGKQTDIIPQNESRSIGETVGQHRITVRCGRKKARSVIVLEDRDKRVFVCGYVGGKLILREIAE